MDFSYLDKPEYKDIIMFDENDMNPYSENKIFFIRKYNETYCGRALHRHNYIQINYIISGSGYHCINNNRFEVKKGDIFIIPPYVPHNILADENKYLEIFEFEFTTDFILSGKEYKEDIKSYLDFAYLEPFMVVEEEVKPYFNLSEKLRIEVEDILNEVLKEYEEKNTGYILIAKALLLKLLVITGRAFSGAIKNTETEKIINKYKTVVLDSVEYINENFDKNISLNEIASSINYSKSHFSYLFKAVMGHTFVEYLNNLRIEKAIELLRNTNKNITDISHQVGFNSIANFNKKFKDYTGQTPRKFR